MTAPFAQLSVPTALGMLTLTEVDGAIVAIDWGWGAEQAETPLLLKASEQFEEYFAGERQTFDLPYDLHGTEFQRRVWAEIAKIPYGQTLSYGDIAEALQGHARSVGTACGRNPLPILIPCHRVVGKKGLGSYTGPEGAEDIESKTFLLTLEKAL